MEKHQLSNTYKRLYKDIIEDLLSQICGSNINYCVRSRGIPVAIGEKFEAYKERALEKMSGGRLDRHKLASCICGAVIEARPLAGYRGAVIVKQANEILALHTGLNVLKFYMVYDFIREQELSDKEKEQLKERILADFQMQFPPLEENICDEQDYEHNLYNALYWTHQTCGRLSEECFRYDIWAYSKIFYELEMRNKQDFLKACRSCMEPAEC